MNDGETNTKAKVYVRDINGIDVDVTTGVQALYDLVMSSMDWGSGFFSVEDAVPVAEIGRLCGFPRIDEAERYLAERERLEETRIVKGDRYK